MEEPAQLPTVEDLKLIADLDEFDRMINAAITWLAERGHHELAIARGLEDHIAALRSGRRVLHNMTDRIILRHADRRHDLESRMRAAGVLTASRPVRKRISEAGKAQEEQAANDAYAAAGGFERSPDEELRLLRCALQGRARLLQLGLLDAPDPPEE